MTSLPQQAIEVNNNMCLQELGDVNTTPPAGMTVSLVDESNLHDWRIVIDGPAGSPYEGGKFTLSLLLPKEYPFKPPTINFKTRIYHPNITSDDKVYTPLSIYLWTLC